MDGSDGAARRTGQLLRLMVMATMAQDNGGYRHVKASMPKQGIAGAATQVQNGWTRFQRAKDFAANGVVKEDDHYASYTGKLLEGVLKNLSESEKI